MTVLLLALGPGVVVLGQAVGPEGIDVASAVSDLIVASPFAGLCLWFVVRTDRKNRDLEGRIETMHREALAREQQLVAQVATRFYDSAHLIREGSALAARARVADGAPDDDRLDRLAGAVETLVERMGEGTDDRPRGPRPGSRRGQ